MECQFPLFFCFALLISVESNKNDRIIGGSDGQIEHFPYQASIRRYNQNHCGAAIIDEKHVVTAAHCIGQTLIPPFRGITVHTGTDNILELGKLHWIDKIIAHPEYNSSSPGYDNDIAVVKLKNPIIFDTRQQKINLPIDDTPDGEPAVVSGWGFTTTSNWTSPNYLQKAEVHLMPNSECTERLSLSITHKQVCALKRKGIGSCMGDSGGPLVVNGTLIGITSWGIPCGLGYPDVYTKVYAYKDFIESVMK